MTDDRLSLMLSEIADLIGKKQQLRTLYRLLKNKWSQHPNCCYWLNAITRSAQCMTRRINSLMQALNFGVYS